MMPAHVKALLRKLSTAVLLLALIPCLLAWLARHSLEPLWPAPVEEIVYLDESGDTGRDLAPVRRSVDSAGRRSIARDRPHSLICVALEDDQLRCGYLLGIRDSAEARMLDQIPEDLNARVVEFEVSNWDTLVMATVDERHLEIPAREIRWLIYPNRLTINERAALAWQRFAGRLADRLPDASRVTSGLDGRSEMP